MHRPTSHSKFPSSTAATIPAELRVLKVLTRLGLALKVPIDRSDVIALDPQFAQNDVLMALRTSAHHSGIDLKESATATAEEIRDLLRDGYPVVVAHSDHSFEVLQQMIGRRIETARISDQTVVDTVSLRRLRRWLSGTPRPRVLVAKKELECDSISAAPTSAGSHVDDHPTPLKRFLGLLDLDRTDLWSVVLFAFVAGVLALATPLAVESLVNVVSWGTYLQPLLILGMMLLTCLGLAGVMRVLQTVLVEMIQRRQFVRIVGDLAHRFPRAQQSALDGIYPRELANRVFDIMTIQKATAVLLLDGVSIVLTTILGLVLLAFYHPFLFGFDIVLVIAMILITWQLGRGGTRTAIEESATKYQVAHWLQDVLAFPTVFKTGGGDQLAVSRANQLTVQYIDARQRQFRVVIRQVVFAVSLQVVASTTLLALGGYLVIAGQLTLGQLVASELVVTVVVGAFAKAGKSLEKFYDLMAGMDKVGYLLDLPIESHQELGQLPDRPAEVSWSELVFESSAHHAVIPATTVAAGSRVAIVGDDVEGRFDLARAIGGIIDPTRGLVQIAGFDATVAATSGGGRLVGYAGAAEIFRGTLRENLDLGRIGIGHPRVREVLQQVGLAEIVLQLPAGLDTELQTGGYPLSETQAMQLSLARVMAAQPRVLVINGTLDRLDQTRLEVIWRALSGRTAPWTLFVVTQVPEIAARCDTQIAVRHMAGKTSR